MNGLITVIYALITFQNIVPISLYISTEAVRTCQALFIYFGGKDITTRIARGRLGKTFAAGQMLHWSSPSTLSTAAAAASETLPKPVSACRCVHPRAPSPW